jgi:catechol 2,3-dioxygenase-like lactoylglutathione lyase family enzyme
MSARFRVGLRVGDVPAAKTFYGGFGFEEVGSVANPDGDVVFAILE